ncbi:MAG: hypothetical protein Kapaf2KO_21710 [Candidatus Kapaibacteriales bacterium]
MGYNLSSSIIENSYSTGVVSSSGDRVGGLVGYNRNSSSIDNSYSTGAVDGAFDVGGLVGWNENSSSIENSYSTGAVDGSGNSVGGLVGSNENSSIGYSYSVGTVTGSSNVGGFIGEYLSGTLTRNYWKEDVSLDDTGNSGNIANIDETSDANMKLQSTYVDWDFTTTPIWRFVFDINNDYPVHNWQYPTPSHPSSFYISGNNKTALTKTFESPASGNSEKYLVLYRTGSELTDLPTDGATYTVGSTIGSSTVGGIITDASATTFTLTGLTMETTYTLRLVPFSGGAGSEDYLTTGDPATLTATTIPTMGEWAMIGFIALIGLGGWVVIRKRFA